MPNAKVTVKGLDVALKQLHGYSNSVKDACKEAVKAHTERLADRARQDVPVDTGRLKESIQTDYSSAGYFGRVRAKTPYAHSVELGTVKQSAQPFLQPAYEAEKQKFVDDIARAVQV